MATANGFLVGVPKAGTTSLASYLGQHPDIFVASRKEPNFHLAQHEVNLVGPAPALALSFLLHRSTITDVNEYERLYALGSESTIRLDASVRYLSHPVALDSIAAQCPDAKIVVVFRDPVDRIVSHYRMNRQFQLEPLGIADALEAEAGRITAGWGYDWQYRRVSTYAPQVADLFERFGPAQVLTLGYGELVRDPDGALRRVFEHFGVATDVTVDRHERGKVPTEPRIKRIDQLVNWPTRTRAHLWNLPRGYGRRIAHAVTRWNSRPPTPIDPRQLTGLAESFEDDLSATAAQLGFDTADFRHRISTATHNSTRAQ
jgi:hypothetical protein